MRSLISFILIIWTGVASAQPQNDTQFVGDRQKDLTVFEEQILRVDQSFTEQTRAEALEKLEALRYAAADVTRAEFELALAEIVALADNGHTRVFTGRWTMAYNRLGVRFLIADDELYVADAIPEYGHLVGQKVLTVGDHDLSALRGVWARYCRGRAGYRDNALYLFIESPELLQAAGLSDSPNTVDLAFESGTSAEVGVTDQWPQPQGIWRWLPEARAIQLAQRGRIEGDPLYLQEPEALFRLVELPERDAAYVQFRANVDFSGRMDMGETTTKAIEQLREIAPRSIIVDQRFNFGGNLNLSRDLMQAIPEIVGPEGHVYAIVSGRTFSAGIASMGYLKQAGGDRVTIIGRPIGDPLEFWAEGSPVPLPQSGALIGVAAERHNYRTGCPEEDCHGSIQRHPIRVDSLDPEVLPPFSYDDVVSGRDPFLEAAFRLMEGSRD